MAAVDPTEDEYETFIGVQVETDEYTMLLGMAKTLLVVITGEPIESIQEQMGVSAELANLYKLGVMDAMAYVDDYGTWRTVVTGPYQSERIGSTNYTLRSNAFAGSGGLNLGLIWWPLLIGLIQGEDSDVVMTSSTRVFGTTPPLIAAVNDERLYILSPSEAGELLADVRMSI